MQWRDRHASRIAEVETVVFDWDGTIADSISTIVRCMQAAAADCSLPVPGIDSVKAIIGLGLREAVVELFSEQSAATVDAVVESYRDFYLSPENREVVLFEGVRDLLELLTERGYLITVATGKSRRGLDRALAETGLHGFFVATRTVDECFSKPHPQMLNELADFTGVSAERMLMVGDGVMDIQMAVAAGALALGVATGAADECDLVASGAAGCLASVRDLSALL